MSSGHPQKHTFEAKDVLCYAIDTIRPALKEGNIAKLALIAMDVFLDAKKRS